MVKDEEILAEIGHNMLQTANAHMAFRQMKAIENIAESFVKLAEMFSTAFIPTQSVPERWELVSERALQEELNRQVSETKE
jgi:hypothetical protein